MDKHELLENLSKVKTVLSSETRWTKSAEALNSQLDGVEPQSDEACVWSLTGAIESIFDEEDKRSIFCMFLNRAISRHFVFPISDGDGRTATNWLSYFNSHDNTDYNDITQALEYAKNVFLSKSQDELCKLLLEGGG